MRTKVYWGLGVLIILLIATTTVVVIRSNKETQRLRDELEQLEAQKKAEKTPHTVDFSETKPPDEPGFIWVQHGDHWDKVPIDTPDTGHGEQHKKPVDQPPKAYTGPFTFHKDLLETHPVEALRQQARQVGHWSADHIPPFPPDDTEAAEFARELYLFRYYRLTGQTDNPAFQKHLMARSKIADALHDWYQSEEKKTPWELARNNDLWKLTWPDRTTGSSIGIRYRTTFTEGFNPLTARPLLPFELELSNRGTTENR